MIDNALFGLRLTYDFTPDIKLKVFTGQQKRQFDLYPSILIGASLEGFWNGGDKTSWSTAPGIGIVNRTLDDETMNTVVNTIIIMYKTVLHMNKIVRN